MYRKSTKRVIDFIISFFSILILLPVFILITVILMFSGMSKPLFFQIRVGKYGKLFRLAKFKTMNDKKDLSGILLPDLYRLTRVGKLLRMTSLDELPQLFNVLAGDMSLIGPRPLLVSYLPLYNEYHKRRHEVRPGLSGWAQINGRNSISWEDKFNLDVWYVDNISFRLDMKILFKTVINIVKRTGINSPDATTMKPFTGNN